MGWCHYYERRTLTREISYSTTTLSMCRMILSKRSKDFGPVM